MLKKALLPLLLLAIALMFVIGCDEDNPTEPKKVNEFELVADATDAYLSTYTTVSGAGVNVSITALFDLLTDGDTSNDPFIIDYRSADHYNSKHIKGAVNIALADLITKVDDGTIPTSKKIVNVCYSGQTASVATSMLNMFGFDAQNLLFGMCGVDTSIVNAKGWVNQIAADERALVSEASTTTATHDFPVLSTGKSSAADIIKAQFAAKSVASTWAVSANDVWDNPANYFVINYWPADEYVNPGHIPGAFQFTPKTSLLSTSTLNLLPTDKTVVVYCYTGQTSAQVVAALKVLGYDAKSLTYGVNGFAYSSLSKSKYTVPTGDFSAILE
ncbi:rhodanese-like domain-containing protein [candidate division KSB1 bacterium]|nr:rhodanese-like domain-containing protein [candidate division KSB1 bacterium]